jgi:hypothetical protein
MKLAVPRVLRRDSVVNGLHWQTALDVGFDPQRLSGALANRAPQIVQPGGACE